MKRILTGLTSLFVAGAAGAAVTLPSVIGPNMVLQQNSDAHLWGWATPGATVTVTPSWTATPQTVRADRRTGRWDTAVSVPSASFDGHEITFAEGSESLTIGNILFGEVWFCSGQSNMEMPLRGFGIQPIEGAAQAIAYSANYPGIRVHTTPKLASYTPQERAEGSGWRMSIPENAGEFSANAYFFATSLSDLLHVPVGLVVCAYGGSKVEGWLPNETVAQYPDFDLEAEINDKEMDDWQRVCVMHNAMLLPNAGYTVKGFLWNQGESNVGCHDTYTPRMVEMVSHFRDLWGDPSLPFYFVEIPGWNYDHPGADNAARLREAQHETARTIDNCEIICTSDLVYDHEVADIHAAQKKPLGERMAFMAADRTYGVKGIHTDYPTLKTADMQGDKAVLTFNNRYGGFTPNIELPGFEVAGEDRMFHPAKAVQDWNTFTVTVSSPEVTDIKAVRYCFKNFERGQVHDMLGLPLVPFRTDDW